MYLSSLAYKCYIFFKLALEGIPTKFFQAFTFQIIPLLLCLSICIYVHIHIYISYIYTYTSIYTQTHSHCYILNMWKICISGVCSGNMMTQFLLMTSLNSSMLRPLFVNKSYEALIFILICVIEVWIQQSYTFNFIIGFNIYWIVRCLSIYLSFYQECFNTMFSPFG